MTRIGRLELLTRIGFAARGLMYILIGFLALKAGRAEDGAGALSYLDSGAGRILLGLMALGFLGYAVWRLSEALLDTEGHGSEAKGIAVRLGGALSGLIHAGLAIYAAKLSSGNGGGGGGDGTEEGAATALSLPGGQVLLTAAAALLLVVGLYQLVKAVRGDFLRHLEARAAARGWVKAAGRIGYAARGIVFVLVALFLWRAARDAQAAEAGGTGEALAALPGTLQAVVAAGLLLFGIFSLVEAIYRRINDPHVVERLTAGARQAAHHVPGV